jgi:hypothetical protein
MCISHNLVVSPPTDGCLGCFCFVIVSWAAMSTLGLFSEPILGCLPRSRKPGGRADKLWTWLVLPGCCLQPLNPLIFLHQQLYKMSHLTTSLPTFALVRLFYFKLLLFLFAVLGIRPRALCTITELHPQPRLFYFRQCNGCEVISHLNLHFLPLRSNILPCSLVIWVSSGWIT